VSQHFVRLLHGAGKVAFSQLPPGLKEETRLQRVRNGGHRRVLPGGLQAFFSSDGLVGALKLLNPAGHQPFDNLPSPLPIRVAIPGVDARPARMGAPFRGKVLEPRGVQVPHAAQGNGRGKQPPGVLLSMRGRLLEPPRVCAQGKGGAKSGSGRELFGVLLR